MTKDDFQRFANPRFLRTVDAGLLHAFFSRYVIPPDRLDIAALASTSEAGLAAVADYLLHTAKTDIPEGLTHDLHRIDRLGGPSGQDALLEAARRRGRVLVPVADVGKTSPRVLALRAFIGHPEIFEEAEAGLAFIAPPSVSEFVAEHEGIVADLSDERLRQLQVRAREIFQADLREEFCEVIPYRDGGDEHVLIRHGAPLTIAEVVEDGQKAIRSYREIASAVLAYSAEEGRLKAWGCAKVMRTALARAYAEIVLDSPGLFSTATSRRICTLDLVEDGRGSFTFRHAHDRRIDKVLIYEAQVNRLVAGPRGAQKVALSLMARDPAGDALAALHASRADIAYGAGGWQLAHLVIKVMLRSDKPRPPVIAVKIKAPEIVSFPRHRHEKLVMDLLRANGILCAREPALAAAAAE
ncbi:MAG: hypothetical protein IT555_03040 [Acetobacteraceae bacterium]|nr:hypothetical protein [Acetobacteraceae bacterium]